MRMMKSKLDTAISTSLRMTSRYFGLLQDKARLICLRFLAVNIALAPYHVGYSVYRYWQVCTSV